MAKELEDLGVWTYNRHDRKRGTEPPDYICRNRDCAANLHEVGIMAGEGTMRRLSGNYVVGSTDRGVILDVMVFDDFSAEIICCNCYCTQPHLHLEDILFNPEAIYFNQL